VLPPLTTIKAGLRLATEALAAELAHPGGPMPAWSGLQWRLATAAAVAHGVSSLFTNHPGWGDAAWQAFTIDQRGHVADRHRRIASLLARIDEAARMQGIPVLPLKGAALHALGTYQPGDRPMADIDLLVREADGDATAAMLVELGYVESFVVWKHRVFRPAMGTHAPGLGEHRDTPVNIELHTRIHERLPLATVEITGRIFPSRPRAGLNAYPSVGALMGHLLLHAAGNICHRSLRLLHLHDMALLSARMTAHDWAALWAGGAPWWALPPLRLLQRYYPAAVPRGLVRGLAPSCPPLLRLVSRHHRLTDVSCSALWHHTLHGVEWLRSTGDVVRYVRRRLRPPAEARQEHADMLRTQLWLQEASWATLPRRRRLLALLRRPLPRMDTLYVVRAALAAAPRAD
jgi:hypothetical protein